MEGICYLYRKGWCIVYVYIIYYIFEENEVLKGLIFKDLLVFGIL